MMAAMTDRSHYAMQRISELPNNGVPVLLMRRTGPKTVKVSIGCRNAYGRIEGWYGARKPTHFGPIPPYGISDAA